MLSVAEAARRLNVSRQTIYDYIKRGHLQAFKRPIGRGTYLRGSDVARLGSFQPLRPETSG